VLGELDVLKSLNGLYLSELESLPDKHLKDRLCLKFEVK
jgi:hypothetical protein